MSDIQVRQDGGVLVMPSIGAKRHAEKVAAWGVDAVLVQGGEGGGASFAEAVHGIAQAGIILNFRPIAEAVGSPPPWLVLRLGEQRHQLGDVALLDVGKVRR